MQQGYVKNTIGFLFLAIFLMVKMAGLHVLAHGGDEDHYAHCVVCDHIVKNQDTPEASLVASDYTFIAPEPIPQEQISKDYKFLVDGILATNQLFSRPPPSFV